MKRTDSKRHRGRQNNASAQVKGPARTCVVCRETLARESLVRLCVSPDGTLVVDLRGKLPGKGAWIHPSQVCVSRLRRGPGVLHRSFGATPDVSALETDLRRLIEMAARDGLSMAAASGALVGGRMLLDKAIKNGSVRHVVFASDASERTIADLRGLSPDDVTFVQLPLDRAALGATVGKGDRAALGIRPCRGSAHLIRQLRRLRGLG